MILKELREEKMIKSDSIIKINNSLIQHGKENNRIYLMKLGTDKINNLIFSLNHLAEKNIYTKIFAKIPENAKNSFLNNGYLQEAFIPKFYKYQENVYFMASY